ncbi:ubiquitin-specific protease otu1 [Toensbergia leucococca]|nr:ubiquitin-specific protease otu1 [Toensbergia leucococca]
MRIRIRGPGGQSAIVVPSTATVGELQEQIKEKTSISRLDVKYGYPPKPLLLKEYNQAAQLSNIEINLDGEQLIVSEDTDGLNSRIGKTKGAPLENTGIESSRTSKGSQSSRNADESSSFLFAGVGTAPLTTNNPSPKPVPRSSGSAKPLSLSRKPAPTDPPELPLPSHASTLLLRIMPDDNSCLFRAFGSAFFGAMDNMTELRSIIAQYIQTNPSSYSQAILEKRPDEYCRWIQSEDAWGGAIELDILSRHFEIEICSIDVQTLRVDRFNEGRPTRCILVYSGIHYDTIALSPSDAPYTRSYAPPEFDTKIFEALDQEVLDLAVDLCRVLQSRHYFTDTAAFSVRCNVCGGSFIGEKGATDHAKKTGHYDFGEGS